MPAVVWGGGVFFRGAWAALRMRTLHMDLPISVGLLAGFLHGAVNTVRGAGDVYFDSVTALIFLLLAGRYVQRRQQRAAADSAELLASLAPSVARLVEAGAVREVPLEALLPGARVEVRAGEVIPADGVVASGRSSLDLSLLSGESRPVAAGPGDRVHAGTVNLASRLEVVVERTGEETRVGRLMALVEEAGRRRAPVVELADRIAGRFVAAVLALAALTFALWARVDAGRAVDSRRRAPHRHVPVRARAGDAAGAQRRDRPGRAGGLPHQGRRRHREAGATRPDVARQDRHAHRGALCAPRRGGATRRRAGSRPPPRPTRRIRSRGRSWPRWVRRRSRP